MKLNTSKEPLGKFFNVNGHKMHFYTEGQGENTFLLMSGSGTRFPALDFKPLSSRLSKNNRIAVVDKHGYGWSERVGDSRDIDRIVDEYRETLKLAGIKPPYTLVPHSLSGLEALRWAQTYPEEIKGIIGLDPAVPEYYDSAKLPSPKILKTIAFISRNNLLTPDMVNEAKWVRDNANK